MIKHVPSVADYNLICRLTLAKNIVGMHFNPTLLEVIFNYSCVYFKCGSTRILSCTYILRVEVVFYSFKNSTKALTHNAKIYSNFLAVSVIKVF